MRISDWSSDVCSSDLLIRKAVHYAAINMHTPVDPAQPHFVLERIPLFDRYGGIVGAGADQYLCANGRAGSRGDRKSDVQGKSVSVSVELGGGCRYKKKKHTTQSIEVEIIIKRN